MKTYYLFGELACDLYHDFTGTAKQFREKLELSGVEHDVFMFELGVTTADELFAVHSGWNEYAEIPEQFYSVLARRRVMDFQEIQNFEYDKTKTDNPDKVLWYRADDNVYYPLF